MNMFHPKGDFFSRTLKHNHAAEAPFEPFPTQSGQNAPSQFSPKSLGSFVCFLFHLQWMVGARHLLLLELLQPHPKPASLLELRLLARSRRDQGVEDQEARKEKQGRRPGCFCSFTFAFNYLLINYL